MELFNMADRFIAVANELLKEDEATVGHVSVALRYAAARFSAHEAAHGSPDIAADKEKALEWYSSQFQNMVSENLDQYISLTKQNSGLVTE
ncbi:MAG: DUF3144 domain-containing protein [Desulfuromonas sp.]|nr:MAG: DUF3144 domain-containing protein [Desulfuromonas sp.]